jgi:hypothetical protein
MDKNEETKTGFKGIGERIEHLNDDATTADDGSSYIREGSEKKKVEQSAKSVSDVNSKPIKYKSPSSLSGTKIFWGIIAIIVVFAIFSQNAEKKNAEYDPGHNRPETPPQEAPAPAPAPAEGSRGVSDGAAFTDGQYRCSEYHHNRSEQLKPSLYEKQNIERQQRSLNTESDELDVLKSQIESDYVDQYSQNSINRHNGLVDDYNSRLIQFRSDANNLQRRIDNFNSQINNYNDYLMANCSKAY